MTQTSKTRYQIIREKNERIRKIQNKIKKLIDTNKKLNNYQSPLHGGVKKYKLERLNKLKIIRNKIKTDLFNKEIEIQKLELSILNY